MIDHTLEFELPLPWDGQPFRTDQIGPINFLVGPNGSGKSQFANALLRALGGAGAKARLLGTDRLSGMEQIRPFEHVFGDNFSDGYPKRNFPALKTAGTTGSGIDTVVLLEERLDLRIRIEATLGHLFDREISLDWDSGNLVPRVNRSEGGPSYRLDREECHGIKELLVLLTHLYDQELRFLIIDEPELNLHPQYQAFFMQEVRKVAGDPNDGRGAKAVFLVTHSPFILDLRAADDIKSVISFDLDCSIPRQVGRLDLDTTSLTHHMARMNAHHKQLFFSDNPIFVEGIHDATLVEAMMEARGASVESAGSCVIDVGGAEEVNQYLRLCQGLRKTAYFLYDLDSLFRGNLRKSMGQDKSIQSFLTSAGLGDDLGKYCGQLESKLTGVVDALLAAPLPPTISRLGEFLRGLGERSEWGARDQWPKARVAVMTAISRHREHVMSVVSPNTVEDIEGHRDQVLTALREKNIHVLRGGTLERYLPCYTGDEYELDLEAKRPAVQAEIAWLGNHRTDEVLSQRYGDLYDAVCELPSKPVVDFDTVLSDYLSDYIHKLQRTVVGHPSQQLEQIQQRMNKLLPESKNAFSLQSLDCDSNDGFAATILIAPMLGETERIVRVDESTNAGMGDFTIEQRPLTVED